MQLRQPLTDRGPFPVQLLPLTSSPNLMPSFAEAAAAASAAGSWASLARRPNDSGGAGFSSPASLAAQPPYHAHQLRPLAGSAGGVGSAAVHGAFTHGSATLLLPLSVAPNRPGATAAGVHALPTRHQEPGSSRFGMPIELQSGSFASSLLPLTNGAAAGNPASSRSLMIPRHMKADGSYVDPASARPPSHAHQHARTAAAHLSYSHGPLGIVSNPHQAQDRLHLPDHHRAGPMFHHVPPPPSSVNGSAAAVSSASWARHQPPAALFNDWPAAGSPAQRGGQPPHAAASATSLSPAAAAAAFQRNSAPVLGFAASLAREAAAAAAVAGVGSMAPVAPRPNAVPWPIAAGAAATAPPSAHGSMAAAAVRWSSNAQDTSLPLAKARDEPKTSAEDGSSSDRANPSDGGVGSSSSGDPGDVTVGGRPGCDRALQPAVAATAATVTAEVGHEDEAMEGTDSLACSPTVPEQSRPESIAVMPTDVRKHLIEGFVIEESSQPFPVMRSSLLTSQVLQRRRGGMQAGRRSLLRISIAAPPTASSSRASSPAAEQSASSVATPDSVLGIDGLSPFLPQTDWSPMLHTTVPAAASTLPPPPKQPKAEPLELAERLSAAADLATQQWSLLGASAAATTCMMCGRSGAKLRAFASKLFCSKSCAAVYRRSFNADGSPVVKRKRGRPPGSGNKLTTKAAKQRPVRAKQPRRLSSTVVDGFGVRTTSKRRSDAVITGMSDERDSHAMDTGSGSGSGPNSPSATGAGGGSAYSADDSLNRSQVLSWSVDDVYGFILALEGCSPYADEFRSQEIDGQALLLLSEDHLVNALNIKLGPALKIISVISSFQ